MAKQLFIKSETLYEIEVNNGVIGIDLANVEVPERIKGMYDSYKEASENFVIAEKICDDLSDEIEEGELFSKKILQQIEDVKNYFKTVDGGIEGLFGKGSMDLVFGDSRTIPMYDQFFDGITPLLEEAGLKVEEHYKNMEKVHRQKYTKRPQDYNKKVL